MSLIVAIKYNLKDKNMNFTSNPCGWEPCEKNEAVELDDVLIDIANNKYEKLTPTFDSSNGPYMSEKILKFKKLGVDGNTFIEFDLNNENNYYALVIDELEINDGVDGKESLRSYFLEDHTVHPAPR